MSGTKIGALASEIAKLMEEYAADVTEDMKEEAKAVAKETAEELKKTSPKGRGSRKGHYNAGWTSSIEREKASAIGIQVYNRKKPGLTHLLEKGHAKRGGGRVAGIPHIAPAEQQAVKEYEKRLKARFFGISVS